MKPIDHSNSSSSVLTLSDEHQVSGYAYYRVTNFEEYRIDPVVYSGPDVMTKFYEHLMHENEVIGSIVAVGNIFKRNILKTNKKIVTFHTMTSRSHR